ncbi:MAG: hypothetical protein ABW007_00365 [Chitinophagaceae bacterium]
MSTAKRVISGSIASWMRIGITMVSQLVLVPVYLSYWDVTTYGIWIAIQAFVSVISVLDQGHQAFMEFEFLKDGKENRKNIALNLWSSVWVGVGIGAIEVLIVILVISFGALESLLGESAGVSPVLIKEASIVLLLQIINWAVLTSIGGIFVRVLSPFGYYARMSWWGVWAAVITSFAPVVAVICGADLLYAGITLAIATILYSIPQYVDIYKLVNKEALFYQGASLKRGLRNFSLSLVISAKSLLENARQQGVRLILAPLSGAAGLVAFSTMRTGANIVLQGLNTITSPLMPELMRFLNQKDQDRMEASFSTVWFVVLFLLAPAIIILQLFADPLFTLWTNGRVPFNPYLFATLSLGVLVFAVAQPAMAVMRGNNLLRPQFLITLIAASIVVGGMFILVPRIGIVGAGASLLLAELAATTGYRIVAKDWLRKNGLSWPQRSSMLALASVWTAAASMFAMISFPSLKWIFCIAGVTLIFVLIRFYWASSPMLVKQKVRQIFGKLPVIKRLIPKYE